MRLCGDRASGNSLPDCLKASFAGASLRGRAQAALLHKGVGHGMTRERQGVDRFVGLRVIHILMQRVSTFRVDKDVL